MDESSPETDTTEQERAPDETRHTFSERHGGTLVAVIGGVVLLLLIVLNMNC